MNPDLILVAALGIFLVLVLVEVPIGVALVVGGIAGVVMLDGDDIAWSTLGAIPYSATSSYALFAIPTFVLLGAVVSNSGISTHIFFAVNRLLGWVPNGAAITAVLATAMMSGISGSSAADVATMGRICVAEMQKIGYSKAHAAAVVAAAGAFAALIPPAIGLVVYAIVAGVSVGQLLLAGIIPGILSALALSGFLLIQGALQQRRLAGVPSASRVSAVDSAEFSTSLRTAVDEAKAEARSARAQKRAARRAEDDMAREQALAQGPPEDEHDMVAHVVGVAVAVALFAIVIGGIYGGYLTATEAGAVGAFAAIVLAAIGKRARTAPMWRVLRDSLEETVHTSAMFFLLLVGGASISYLVVSTNAPARITDWVIDLPVHPKLVVALFLVFLLLLGTFMDGLSIILLTVPIVAPVIDVLGYNELWFGILFMKMMEIGLITPPVGLNCFVIAGTVPGLKVEDVFRKILPFVVLDLCVTAVLFLVPGIITWLPGMSGTG